MGNEKGKAGNYHTTVCLSKDERTVQACTLFIRG